MLRIEAICLDVLAITRKKALYHSQLQKYIVSLAEEYGLQGRSEHMVPNFRGYKRNGRIDVTWLGRAGTVALFEIDSSRKIKSVGKLLAAPAAYRFWIYYGSADPYSFLKQWDPSGYITLVRPNLHPGLERGKRSKRAAGVPSQQAAFELYPEWESLEAGYAAMALDEASEAEALEWAEALLLDIEA